MKNQLIQKEVAIELVWLTNDNDIAQISEKFAALFL